MNIRAKWKMGEQGRNPRHVLEVEPRGAGDFVWMMSILGP